MELMEGVVEAAALYKAALEENQAELLISLDACKICYVANMPHSHRTQWAEANLIIFYIDPNPPEYDIFSDYLLVSRLSSGTRRGLYFRVVADDDLRVHICKMACDNLRLSYSRSLCPSYIEIDPQLMLRVAKLLVFT
jgi:hypothetical protein